MSLNNKSSKVFYGWYVVGACTIITLYVSGVVSLGFTVIFEPVASEFNWSYAQVSLAASLRGLEEGLLAPLMGFLVDRWGSRKLVIAGAISGCLGLLLLSRVSSLGMFYASFIIISLASSTCSGTVTVTAVTNWFRRNVGMATGILVSGWALGGLMVPGITLLVDNFGWRIAMSILGLGLVVVVVPLSFLIRHKPEDYGYQPDGDTVTKGAASDLKTQRQPEESIYARQALRGRVFWHLGLAALCHMFVVSAVITHLMPYLSTAGMTRSFASIIALILPLISAFARLGGGWLGSKYDNRYLYAGGFAVMAAGMILLGFSGSAPYLLIPFLLAVGIGWGTNVTLRMLLVRHYFGRTNYGTILGCVSGVMMLGSIAGAPIAGWVVDTWGNYQGAWLGFSIVAIAGVLLTLTMPPKQSPAK